MWISRPHALQARMPSMRPFALNPRAPVSPSSPISPAAAVGAPNKPPEAATPGVQADPSEAMELGAEAAVRDGGFHESSYELQHGLLVSESDWPDDVTVPGSLGER